MSKILNSGIYVFGIHKVFVIKCGGSISFAFDAQDDKLKAKTFLSYYNLYTDIFA